MQQPGNNAGRASTLLKQLQLIVLVFLILYFGKGLFIPAFFGLFIAIVMYPFCKWLEQRHISRSLAITAALAIVVLLFSGLVLLLVWQLNLFRQDIPGLVAKMKPLLAGLQQWISERFSISETAQHDWLLNTIKNSSGSIGRWLRTTLNATGNAIFSLFLIPIYAALFLYHRKTFVRFLHRLFRQCTDAEIDTVLNRTVLTYSKYIKGMIMVYLIVGILNSIGLLVLGVRYAILFGMLTAIMTIIPYIGIIVSAMLPITVAFITTDSVWYPVGVILVFTFVQYLEANVIFPKVVGGQLNVGTWATLVAIIAGGIVWGVAGMILFIPFVAILKIISDHVPELAAWNILLNREDAVK